MLNNRKFISTAIVSTMLVTTLFQAGQATAQQQFSDVPSNHWAASEIQYLVKSGWINGYEDGTFKPDRYMTEEEFLALAVNMLFGKPKDTTPKDPYEKISWADWAYDFVEQKGINSIGEYGERRNAEITRAEVARIIYKLLNGNIENLQTKKAVRYLYQKNLTSGTYNNKADYFENYGPTDRLTRAQAAVFLKKVRDYKSGKLKATKNTIPLTDSLVNRVAATAKKYGVKVSATNNPERYETEITGNGIRLVYQFEDHIYGDISENWHMTIVELDQSKIPFMASLLVKLGLPMSETETQTLLKDLFKLQYGASGETYKKGNTKIYTSYYYGYHIQWGEEKKDHPTASDNTEPFALFVNGEEKRGPGFNTFLEQIFSRGEEIYIPIDSLYGLGITGDLSDDYNSSVVDMGNGEYWNFQWDGVPKRNGSTYPGKQIGNSQGPSINGIMKGGSLALPLSFIDDYYPVSMKKENKTTIIFIGTVPENPTTNYFGTKGQYPSTFDFNPLDPNVNYPGGWKAPQLKSTWSPDQHKNYQAFKNELGFKDGGQSFGITGAYKAITLFDSSPNDDVEVTIRYTGWGTPPGKKEPVISESFKIPVVSAQLFKFYFEDKWKSVWNYCNQNDIPDEFILNGRKVKVAYYPVDGTLHFNIGYKTK
ncbi:S-layer homology domain-containing protein [Ammoniphilus resinae]|uniref:SLH domain-containing protein n=1 Tax=Ammoniphilus resinae TaxID=861532 RepID=A0ABS4GMI3_9BACL|nr:S-layer homology domain-containing protein [Ammoniphilus resinae]MBP1931474.1 hypothetical protein [Ammoniphilus resinae]